MSKINLNDFEGHTPGPWHEILMQGDEYNNGYADLQERGFNEAAQDLIAAAPHLLAEVEWYRLQDCAIKQAEHMRAQVGDNTWHYAMEVWLYPETHYWEVDDEVALIERYITTNRDAWVKRWGEPSDLVQRRNVPH